MILCSHIDTLFIEMFVMLTTWQYLLATGWVTLTRRSWKETERSKGWGEGGEASYVVIRIIDGTISCDFSIATGTVVTEPLIPKSTIGDFPNQFHLPSSVITLFPKSMLILSSDLIGLPNGAMTTLLPHLNSVWISCLLWGSFSQFLFITAYSSLENVLEVCRAPHNTNSVTRYTYRAGVAATCCIFTWEVPGSKLAGWGFSLFSSVPPGKFWLISRLDQYLLVSNPFQVIIQLSSYHLNFL